MFITGIGTATPGMRYTQAQCWEALQQSDLFERLQPRSRAILRKLFNAQNGIESRSLALDPLTEAFELNPDALHARFVTHAPPRASTAGMNARNRANLQPEEVDVLIVSTCTGYVCPGLTSYVVE